MVSKYFSVPGVPPSPALTDWPLALVTSQVPQTEVGFPGTQGRYWGAKELRERE